MPLIKLYDYSAEDKYHQTEIEDADTGSYSVKKQKKYTIEMYGLDENGTTYNVSTTFQPWFCIKLNGIVNMGDLLNDLKTKVKNNEIRDYLKPKPWDKNCDCFSSGKSIHECGRKELVVQAMRLNKGEIKWNKNISKEVVKERRKLDYITANIDNQIDMDKTGPIRRCKLYGFDNFKKHAFFKMTFNTVSMMNKFKALWYTRENDFRKRKLIKYMFQGEALEIYESTLPPMLRYFHEYDLNPSGWIEISDEYEERCEKNTTQDFEYDVEPENIKSVTGKETAVPYKQMCWDIEASSSHGDFPLAKKGWDKLIKEIIDIWKRDEVSKDTFANKRNLLIELLTEAINGRGNRVSQIFLKEEVDDEMMKKFLRRLDTKWQTMIGMIDREDIDGLCCDGTTKDEWGKFKKRGITTKYPFPKVEGDVITFIGSTFLKYGDKKQYLNHMVSLGKCNDIPEVDNREIISCETETELLMVWAGMIEKENPDMMIGYNIMGFDWKFIIERTEELGIKEEFLKMLSKNRNQNWKKMIKKKEIKIASGTHQSTFIMMEGRVQLDLYSHFRKEENLPSYKLDHVSSYFIGDGVKKIDCIDDKTKVFSKNLMGIKNGDYISFEILGNSTDMYMNGKKFPVEEVNYKEGTFVIDHKMDMSNNKLRWCLNKDDITLEEMFNANTPGKRAKVAKYCFQDCNLLHNLMRKCDILTGFIEFSAICKIPLSFTIERGQGIKLLSFIAYKCREKNILMPDLEKGGDSDGYEGAICLTPKTGFYPDNPIAVNDYSSLYPSCMVSENISHDSKVWTKEYNLGDELILETGEKDEEGNYVYDNLEGYKYVDVKFDTYKYVRKTLKGAKEKLLKGYKVCRYIQFKNDKKGIMPSVLTELLSARKATKKLKAQAKDPFMKSVYDKRQLGIKVVANSLYGQCGARTSSFYDIDIAASTTATGRKLLMYAKTIIEDCYSGITVDTKYGKMKSDAEYIYGDTDSVFFTFNLKWAESGERVVGKEALDVTIELAKEAGELATKYLKVPHDLEYEKTFMPFLLLAKKKYVGMLYENDINYCKRKSMGIVLKRRDNAPCVKDSYGGVVDILMNQCNANEAVKFIKGYLDDMINEKIPMKKLVITKKLNGYYKNPKQIAHKVLADRMGDRDPGNKPAVGSRLPFVYIKTKRKMKLQGDKIEHPEYIEKNNLKPDYEHYITNQIMKPLLQLFGLLLEQLKIFKKQKRMYKIKINGIKRQFKNDHKKCQDKISKESDKRIKKLIFDEYINTYRNNCAGQKTINTFFKKI